MNGNHSPQSANTPPDPEPVAQQESSTIEAEDSASSPFVAALPESALRDSATSPALGAFWEVVKRIPTYGRLIAAMSRDPEVPVQAKATLLVGGAYLISPVDLIPGLIPVAGQIDDLYVVLTALQLAIRSSPPDVAKRHLAAQGLHPDQIDHDLAVIRRLVREGLRKAISLSGKVAVEATHRVAQLTNKARTTLANRGTRTS